MMLEWRWIQENCLKEFKMQYRIVHRKNFFIIGFSKRITLQFHGENRQLDSLYELMTDEMRRKLLSINDCEPYGIVSVSADFSDRTREGSLLTQYLGTASSRSSADGFDILPVPESDWAVFTSCGSYPEALQDTWAEIYASWLASSDYELTGGPEMLWNESDDTSRKDFRSEIWIPVKKKI